MRKSLDKSSKAASATGRKRRLRETNHMKEPRGTLTSIYGLTPPKSSTLKRNRQPAETTQNSASVSAVTGRHAQRMRSARRIS